MSTPPESPPALPGDASAFVGREAELAEIEALLAAATAGHGGLVLLRGEPGVGKTRLLDELAERARRRGVAVAWGRCWEEGGAPPYWPWAQVIRAQRRTGSDIGPEADAATLATLVPELHSPGGHGPRAGTVESEAEHARFVLFDAVAAWLRAAADRQPTLVLLDDVHAADVPSLRLLAFLAHELRGAALLLVCAHGDGGGDLAPAILDVLAAWGREGLVVSLAGLPERHIARFVQLRSGVEASATMASALHRQTGGNPFFLDELVRVLRADGSFDASTVRLGRVPGRIQEAIERRMAPLSSRCRAALETASVLGLECSVRHLAVVAGVAPAAVLSDLSDAVTGEIVTVGNGPTPRVQFRHALFREALYQGLSPAHRAALHGSVGAVLEDDAEAPLAELAHHFLEAAEGGSDVTRAAAYARRAAAEATARMAFEDAVALYERALHALSLSNPSSPSELCVLLIDLGEARQRLGGHADPAARSAFEQARETARRLERSGPLLARAALGIAGIAPEFGRVDRTVVRLLDDALTALGRADDPVRSRVMARLSAELAQSPQDAARREALSQEAVALAERVGDPATLGYVLARRHVVLLGPGSVAERRELASEIIELAQRGGDRELEAEGRSWRLAANLELGDVAAADRDLDGLAQRAAETRNPHYLWLAALFRAMRALLAARFEDAERLVHDALAIGQRAGDPNASLAYGAQLAVLRRGQGRLTELLPLVREMAATRETAPIWETTIAHVCAMVGDTEQARARFVPAYQAFSTLPRDATWLLHLGLLGEVCAVAGDRERGAVLLDLLAPFADRQLVAGPGAVCLGAVVRISGLLAAMLERWEESLEHLERAARSQERMGALAWAAETACDQAMVHLGRDAPGDRDAARAYLARAGALASRLALPAVMARVEAIDRRLRDDVGKADRQVLRRDGDHWRVEFAGAACRLRDSKGVRVLAELLRRPGVDCHVASLVAAIEGRDPVADPDGLCLAESERHRVSVSRTVHAVLDRLGRSLPALAEHLTRTLHTGTFCRYDPDPRAPGYWEF